MSRRFISAVALVAGLGMYALAAEQATFILNNGERRTGELSASGSDAANFVNGQLTLNGQPIPLDQVAVIDMTGGSAPPSIELSRVPATGGQAVVMKSGHAEGGKFVNIVRGDTLGAGAQPATLSSPAPAFCRHKLRGERLVSAQCSCACTRS